GGGAGAPAGAVPGHLHRVRGPTGEAPDHRRDPMTTSPQHEADAPAPEPAPGDHGTLGDPGYHGDKSAYLRRLKLIEGQVRGVHRMVGEDAYCIDVLTQISAVSKALQSVA